MQIIKTQSFKRIRNATTRGLVTCTPGYVDPRLQAEKNQRGLKKYVAKRQTHRKKKVLVIYFNQ